MPRFITFIIVINLLGLALHQTIKAAFATNSDGASYTEIGECSIKSCFINLLIIYKSEILKQQKSEDGTFYEIYKIQREADTSLDNYISGLISVGNNSVWKVVTDSIEGFVSDNSHIIFKATYNRNEEATKIELQFSDSNTD